MEEEEVKLNLDRLFKGSPQEIMKRENQPQKPSKPCLDWKNIA